MLKIQEQRAYSYYRKLVTQSPFNHFSGHMLQAGAGAEVQTRETLRNYPSLTELIVWLGGGAYRMEGLSKSNAQSTGC